MIQTIDFRKVLSAFVTANVAISVGIFLAAEHYFHVAWSTFKIIGISSSVSLVLLFLVFSTPVASWGWAIGRRFSKNIYPDLTGSWAGTIKPSNGPPDSSLAPLSVNARIRHTLLDLHIDFHGDHFESITLSATPVVEKGQHHLHYVFRSSSKLPGRPAFNGTAMLRALPGVTDNVATLSLSGPYFTERGTVGAIELHRTGVDPDEAFPVKQAGA